MNGDLVGLCLRCRHARPVPTERHRYWMCGLSLTDPGYDKYPRLPVLACPGYELGPEWPGGDQP